MIELIQSLFAQTYIRNALFACFLASFICGMIGTFIVIKKISHISGSIAHSVLGGIGVAYFFGLDPILGAYVFAVIAALIIGLVRLRSGQHEDTIISALWSVGMAIGVIFIYLTPGYNIDLMSFLFGNILLVTGSDLLNMLVFSVLVFVTISVFYRLFITVCFDEEHSRLRGIPVDTIYIVLLIMIALTVVVLIRIIGLIMVIALLTLPAAIGALFTRTPFRMMISAGLLSLVFTLSGLALSYRIDLPSGALIILICGLGYLIALGLKKAINRN